jgi:peptidoglycan/xylan/chitin deacetylase (PgdA/CDA1 family)
MALILRIDVDRPYGKEPLIRHVLSRVASDLYMPRVGRFGYLKEVELLLGMLEKYEARAYLFFRRCTLPTATILRVIDHAGHEIGLHLENSRSFDTFLDEKRALESHINAPVTAFSKHGSGGAKYGLRHYAPYEPERYVGWARQAGMTLFLGNLEDPTLDASVDDAGVRVYPSAFWLEPAWRNTDTFTIDWLLGHARTRDVVLLMHPENVLADPILVNDLDRLLRNLETKVLR